MSRLDSGFRPHPRDRPYSHAKPRGNLPNTPARKPNGRFDFCRKARPSQASPVRPCPSESGANAFRYHGALELSEYAHHLEHCPPARRGRIEALLMQVKVNSEGVQFRKELD
jgi:hypothetical protein